MAQKNNVCKTCLFVNLYEMNRRNFKDFLFNLAESMITNIKKTNTSLYLLYKDCKRWKKENDHDCYKGKNMQIVK